MGDIITGLVGHYKFDETGGTTAADSSPTANDATLVNGPTFVPGKIGNACNFDGIDDIVTAPRVAAQEPAAAITIAFWMNKQAVGVNSYVISKSFSNGYLIVSDVNEKIEANIWITSVRRIVLANSALTLGNNHHVAITYDGTFIKIYLDKVLDITSPSFPGTITPYSQILRIGNKFSLDRQYAGWLDDVRIYNRALIQADVDDLFAFGADTVIKQFGSSIGSLSGRTGVGII